MSPATCYRIVCVCSLMMVSASCTKKPDEASSSSASSEKAGISPAALSPRRDRAGLDLGERGERPPAASLIVAPPPSDTPPMETGPQALRAQAAANFMGRRWLPIISGDDEGAYRDLLHKEFKGMVPGEDQPVDATRWISIGAMGAHRPIAMGPLEVHPMPGPLGRTTVRFHELRSVDPCMVANREITLQSSSDTPEDLRVVVLSLSSAAPCEQAWGGAGPEGDSPEHQARAAHDALKAAWSSGDTKEVLSSLAGTVSVREYGREIAAYDHEVATGGEGRWLLDEMKGFQTTGVRVVPPWALISGADSGAFVYRWSGAAWRLSVRERSGVSQAATAEPAHARD